MSKAMLATMKGTDLIAKGKKQHKQEMGQKEEQHKQEMGQRGRNNAWQE